ncbi:MAG: TIGR04150 pseudo-rSAM protein [Bacteroidales bacterium]|jgi:pseudo-rSAM protein|nr:TIGR04150 pseudo-rSAM protein [Bacteroidales bacterium]
MFNTGKNYWLYIASHVYCRIQEGRALLYNTQSGTCIECASGEIIVLLQSLHEKKNLGAVCFEGKKLAEEPYRSFLAEFCEKNMGGLAEVEQDKPIQLMPILNLQRDVEKLQKDRERSSGENVLQYLQELNIYVNDTCDVQCPLCTTCFRQGLCCTSNRKQSHSLSKSTLQKILTQIQYAPVGKLNIFGGNISEYAYFKELETLLQPFKEYTHLWVHYANAGNAERLLSGFKYDVPVTPPIDETWLCTCLNRLNGEQTTWHFFITGEEDYQQTEQMLEKYAIPNYVWRPVYTQANRTFFEEQVYMTRDDIFSKPLSFRQIFAHQKLNTHFFGSLTVLANGDVYANVNSAKLGNVRTDSILNLINKEMSENTAWRRTRDKAPCTDCLYQYLCPSPSNYERVIGQPDLCRI